jgi:hypothetical protein
MLVTIGFTNLSIIIVISIILIAMTLGGNIFNLNPLGSLGKVQGISKSKPKSKLPNIFKKKK